MTEIMDDMEDNYRRKILSPKQKMVLSEYIVDAEKFGVLRLRKGIPTEVAFEEAFTKGVQYLFTGEKIATPDVLVKKFDIEFKRMGWDFDRAKKFFETLDLPIEVLPALDKSMFILDVKKG